jgi:hypothetical protein
MKYFIPDWEDRLDPNYDFQTDTFGRERNEAYKTDIYAHQIFSKPPYDGILISLALFNSRSKITLKESKNGDKNIRELRTIKDYLKIPASSNLEVMGDCGAFSYINEDTPPAEYDTKLVADVYHNLGFDYGVSVDHMIPDFILKEDRKGRKKKIKLTKQQKEKRRQLTLDNAEEFLRYHRERNYDFIPIGVAQGSDPIFYADSVYNLLEMGYRYIGLGSLVPKRDDEIVDILKAVKRVIDRHSKEENIRIHLFGVLRIKKLVEFRSLGVTSFDSASYLRKAWLRSDQNYLAPDKNWFSAIRIPYSNNPRLVKNAKEDGISERELKQREEECLKLIREYAQKPKNSNLERVLDAIMNYDSLLLRGFEGNHHREKYMATLLARPWEKCNCEVCKSLGVDVVIFRGANRNKRRGFHNTKIFYDLYLNSEE